MKGKLYLVATPIGNLKDITYRAVEVLKEVDIIAAEDTRHSLKLLNHLEISKPLVSYHRHNEENKSEFLINKILNGENIAIITDAGTPAISDPGEEIVKLAIKNHIEIIPIPGACALINALIISGMNTKEFSFYGFLPLNKKNRKIKIEEIKKEQKTIILYEAPHKIINTLKDINEEIGDINISIIKELTKIHEKVFRGKISEIIEKLENIKGEIIIVIEGNKNNNDNNIGKILNDMNLEEHYNYYEKKGFEKKEIIKKIAKDKNVNKNEIYKNFLNK
ncbi:MAG TPA: 16S rRNA (cytidine(1402)-2'-O)-methyltransferase [Clostridia bacterium]|nr:16S rRNA (cytidine(1402)-2'-O)-methyltransferase [Clostridia bacterium]